jgi:potassium-transporting ATPase KdpC subunit
MFASHIRPGLMLVIVMTLLTGVVYPSLVTAVSGIVFPSQAHGSLLRKNGALIGSELLGQNFSSPQYFWGRPSATSPQPYNGVGSGGSNLGPLNPALIDKVKSDAKALRDADPMNTAKIPVELVTGSASGLDPDISPAAAEYQAARVARARNIPLARIRSVIAGHRHDPILGVIGEPRINVLELNLALDQIH